MGAALDTCCGIRNTRERNYSTDNGNEFSRTLHLTKIPTLDLQAIQLQYSARGTEQNCFNNF